jgi:hypothetical protein
VLDAHHAGRVPEWYLLEDQYVNVNIRAVVVLQALFLGAIACAGADGNQADPTDITSVGHGSHSKPADSSAATPPKTVDTSSGPSSSTGTGLSGLAFVSDDFTGYAGTADLMGRITANAGGTARQNSLYSDGSNTNLIAIDKSVTYNGHPTMKYTQPGGVHSTPVLGVYFSARPHIWYRVKVRFSSGFSTTGTLANYGNAYKLLAWGWSGAEGSGRLEIANTSEYELYENVQDGPSLIGGGKYLEAGKISTEWTDGSWYDYIIEVDHTQSTGVIRLWRARDGQTPVFQGQTQETMKNGSSMPPLTNVSVGLNFNQNRAANQSQAVWWGEWEVVDGSQHANPFGVSK